MAIIRIRDPSSTLVSTHNGSIFKGLLIVH
jgi:hypothetical protein